MTNTQFDELLTKLNQILIAIQAGNSDAELPAFRIIENIRTAFFHQLEAKTGWGRNEIKAIFDAAVESAT